MGWVGVEGRRQHREEKVGKIICGCGTVEDSSFLFPHLPVIYM